MASFRCLLSLGPRLPITDVNSPPSMSAMQMWHEGPSISDVNFSLRCLLADVLLAIDVNSSLRCLLLLADGLAATDVNSSLLRRLLAGGHCMRPMLLLDACLDQKGASLLSSRCDDDV